MMLLENKLKFEMDERAIYLSLELISIDYVNGNFVDESNVMATHKKPSFHSNIAHNVIFHQNKQIKREINTQHFFSHSK